MHSDWAFSIGCGILVTRCELQNKRASTTGHNGKSMCDNIRVKKNWANKGLPYCLDFHDAHPSVVK